MTLVLVVLGMVVVVNCCFMGFLISDVASHSKRGEPEPGNALWLGIISFFQFVLSASGVSDFAIGAAVYSKLKWVSAKKLPGTVNTAAVIPVAISAIIYITTIEVDIATLVVPIVAQIAGAYLMPRIAVKMPVKLIRIFLALGMLITVGRIAGEGLGFFPVGGAVTSLSMGKLVLLGSLCFLYGALNNFGLGSYTPTMATVYALGMSPAAAFPIMMGAAAFSVPVASIQFVRYGSYSRKITVITAICGSAGILAAAFLVGNMDVSLLKWLVAGFLLYSACSMMLSAYKNKDDAVAEPKPRKTERAVSVNSRLAGFCLALILICTIFLVVIFVGYFQAGWYAESVIPTESIHSSTNERIPSLFLSLMLIIFFMLFVALISLMIIIRQLRNDNIVVQRQSEELDRLNKMKTGFLQDMSHEMKAPLTIIATGIDFANQEIHAENSSLADAGDALEMIRDETQRLGRMIGGMAELASMNEISENRKRVSFASLLRDGAESFRYTLEQKKNSLTVQIAQGMPDVFIERDKFTQVIANLLSNAADHTKNGWIKVKADFSDEYITVRITDTGEGVAPDMLPDVFKRGVSGKGSTGYGLYICKTVVEAHGGTISIESGERRVEIDYSGSQKNSQLVTTGTVVTFTVPIYGGQEAGHFLH